METKRFLNLATWSQKAVNQRFEGVSNTCTYRVFFNFYLHLEVSTPTVVRNEPEISPYSACIADIVRAISATRTVHSSQTRKWLQSVFMFGWRPPTMTCDTSLRDSERQRGTKRDNETYSPVFALPAGTTPGRRTEGSSTCRYENGMYQICDFESLDNHMPDKSSIRGLDLFPTAHSRLPRNK